MLGLTGKSNGAARNARRRMQASAVATLVMLVVGAMASAAYGAFTMSARVTARGNTVVSIKKSNRGSPRQSKNVSVRPQRELEVSFYGNWYDGGYSWRLTRKPSKTVLTYVRRKVIAARRCCGFPEKIEIFFKAQRAQAKPASTRLVYTLWGPGRGAKPVGRVAINVTVGRHA